MPAHQEKESSIVQKRMKGLAHLLGIREEEVKDLSLSGRLKTIAKLKTARRIEIARGRAGSWLYDVNRHLNLCAALRCEYEALAAFSAESTHRPAEDGDCGRPQA